MFTMNRAVTLENLMYKVYAWMFTGLFITAAASYALFASPDILMHLLSSKYYMYGLMALQLGVVIYLSAYINTMSYRTAIFSFLFYSFLVGITLSPIFFVYTMSSIFLTFATTACMFGGMAIYGYYTETDLTKYGTILLMGLWGILIASLANWYFQSSMTDFIISIIGVLLFTALTAYDVQKIKLLASSIGYEGDEAAYVEKGNKIALIGALQLYLDFLNLFLYMLRFMGKKRRD